MSSFRPDPLHGRVEKSSGILRWTLIIVALTIAVSVLIVGTLSEGNLGALVQQLGEHQRQSPTSTPSVTAATQGHRELSYRANANGHFIIAASINGTNIPMLFDSGASTIALSPADAETLGIRRQRLRFTQRVATANGVIVAAPVTLDRIRIGQLVYYDVAAMVIDAPLNISLLGMSFLRRLDGFEVVGDRLILRW